MAKRTLTLPKNDDGTLASFTFPGCYPIYYVDRGNSVQCPECANKNYTPENETFHDYPVDADVNYEDANLTCDECSKRIESAYAEDEKDKTSANDFDMALHAIPTGDEDPEEMQMV